jgi:hypothetical protein
MPALMGLITLVAGLSLKKDVRPVIGPDRIEELLVEGTPNDPAQWPETPLHSLEFTTLARLARAQMAAHWANKDTTDIQGLLPAQRIRAWIREAKEPKGTAIRRPAVHSMDAKQLETALKLELEKAKHSLEKTNSGWSSQTLSFWLLLASAWISVGLPPFRSSWRWLLQGTPAVAALPLGAATIALSWDLIARIALPLAPLAIVSNLQSALLYMGVIGPAALWILARKRPSMRTAISFILPMESKSF